MKTLKKYSSLIITVLVVILVILGVFFLSKLGQDKYFKEISYEDFNKNLKDESTFVYVTSKKDTASFEAMKEFANNNSLKFRYIYSEDLTDEQREKLLKDKNNNALYFDDKVYNGSFTGAAVKEYLMEEEVIDKAYVEITMADYTRLLKEKEYFVAIIGRTGCSFCSKYQPVMNEIIKSTNLMMYYVDISKFADEDHTTLIESASYLKETNWGTPTTLVFKKGKFVEAFSGYAEKEEIMKFLKSTGAVK